MRPAMTTTKTRIQVYSRWRKAIAPSLIASEISTIFLLPRGWARTERA